MFAVLLAHQKSSCRFTGLVFHSGAPRGFAKNSSNCAVVVYKPSASIGPLSPSPRLQSRDRKPRVHDSTALVFLLVGGSGTHRKHPDSCQEPEMVEFLPRLQLQRWAAEARVSELTLFLVCSRFAVSLTAHASPADSWSGFLRARSKVGPFERSSYRCGQPMFWSLATLKSEKTSKTDRTASSFLGPRTGMATMFGALKSFLGTARGQHLSAQTCGLESDSRRRRHGDFILAGRIRDASGDGGSTAEKHQITPCIWSRHRHCFSRDRPCQLATRVIEMLSECLNLDGRIFPHHVCKNAQLSAAWQPVLV